MYNIQDPYSLPPYILLTTKILVSTLGGNLGEKLDG